MPAGAAPGERRGGRQKGSVGKKTVRKALLLAPVAEQFRAADYDPMAEMVKLAKKAQPSALDNVKFGFHQVLAKKYYPDVAALKISGDPEAPIVVLTFEQRLSEAFTRDVTHANGHAGIAQPSDR